MDYSDIFSYMQAEVTLIAVIVLLFLYDLIAGERGRRRFSAVACGLLAVQVLANVVPGTAGEVFGGMFCYVPMHTVVKSVLAIGALIVCLQADTWLMIIITQVLNHLIQRCLHKTKLPCPPS